MTMASTVTVSCRILNHNSYKCRNIFVLWHQEEDSKNLIFKQLIKNKFATVLNVSITKKLIQHTCILFKTTFHRTHHSAFLTNIKYNAYLQKLHSPNFILNTSFLIMHPKNLGILLDSPCSTFNLTGTPVSSIS